MARHADETPGDEPDGRGIVTGRNTDVPRAGRRRFLTGIGATGLAVAAATFGRSTPAFAVDTDYCCDLRHPPGDDCFIASFATCEADMSYTWSCKLPKNNPPLLCQCCETKVHTGDHLCPAGKSSFSCVRG